MSTVLDKIVSNTREELRQRQAQVPLAQLEQRLDQRGDGIPFAESLAARPGVAVIAEHKRKAPSADRPLREGSTVSEVVSAYERAGAAALSVLTDSKFFSGSLTDLVEARAAVELPILRKDFMVDQYQIVEAAVYGADAILLIVAALSGRELFELNQVAKDLELDVLVEVHNAEELQTALEVIDPEIIGINNRNLKDLTIDLATTFELLTDVPAGKLVVSESGISEIAQVDELERVGIDAILVGSHFMKQPDLETACRDFVR